MKNGNQPRIYVACLASYNSGILHGKWLDVDPDGLEKLREGVHEILKSSPEPNITMQDFLCDCRHSWHEQVNGPDGSGRAFSECPRCGADATPTSKPYPSAEEWAIHDQDGFFGVNVGEFESLATLVKLAEALAEHGEPFASYVNCLGGMAELDTAIAQFEDAYRGEYDDVASYAEEFSREVQDPIPKWLDMYVDWEAMGRDWVLNGDVFAVPAGSGKVYVFSGRV